MENIPTKEEAEKILLWGFNKNPGPWMDHSKVVARSAEKIALKCGLNENMAYIIGLLHDIGRYEGVTGLRHIYAGYNLMLEKGYEYNAKICLTHSFPSIEISSFNGFNDCTNEELKIIEHKLRNY